MGVSEVLSLLGGVALFLFGMSLMGDSLKKVAGNKLEVVLYRLSGTQLKGILLGTGVTAVIQSSSATSVMVVGFVNSEMMKVRQAIGIIMGAIIGTSITGWIIALSDLGGTSASGWLDLLSTETLTAVVAVIGIVLYMFSSDIQKRHVGGILLGFAVLMYGMKLMSGSVAGLKSDAGFIKLLTDFSNPFLGILVGLAFTSILQSASAAIGILQALAITGAIRFEVAFPIIMGIAIGAAVPVLLSAMGATADGKKTALSYLLIDALGVIIVSVVFYAVNAFVDFGFMSHTMSAVSIALVNTVFRIVIVIILIPFIGFIEKLASVFVKEKKSDKKRHDMDRLEERFLAHPAVAIEQTREVINSMAGTVLENVNESLSLVDSYTKDGFASVADKEEIVDHYEDKLGTYLVKIMQSDLTSTQNTLISKYLHSITDFERMSDHALNIAQGAQEMHDKKMTFSEQGKREIGVLCAAVSEIVGLAVTAFVNEDLVVAHQIEPLEEKIDALCDEMKLHHINRISDGTCTLQHGFVFNDYVTNLERIADHCSNIGVAMIELADGVFDTHEYYNKLMAENTDEFKESFAMYDKKYKL